MKHRQITFSVAFSFLFCLWADPQSSHATLTINLVYIGSPATEPSYDPGGTNLMASMNAAAEHWGRSTGIIQDNHTITIGVFWADLSDGNGTLGLHTNLDGGPVPKPTIATIQMDTQFMGVDRLWYFDPTPTNHSEFNLTQTRYGGLSPANQAAWYNGSPPAVLEAGFAGGATITSPLAAQNGSDMLSVALHEIGHALGMTTNVAAPQTVDGDYDVNPGFVGGFSVGITDDGTFHLPQTNTVMAPGINAGTRRLPSASDVFSVASASNWTNLFLHRTDFIGGTVFSDPTAWIGGKTPNFTADAFVRSFSGGGIAVAQTSMQFQNLSVFDAWNVTALQNNVLLDVAGTTTIDGTSTSAGSTKIVLQGSSSPGSLLDTNDLLLVAGGRLELDGQVPFAAAKVGRTLDVDPNSSIFGHGFLTITNDVVTDVLNNRGLIESDGGDLRLAASNTINPVFDLDGDDPLNIGNLRAVTGDLSVFGQHVGQFAGELRVGPAHEATFDHPFTVHVDGNVLLFSNLVDTATFSGSDLVVRGDIVVDKLGRVGKGASNLVTFEGPAVSGGAARVIVEHSDDELSIEGPAIFYGGQYVGVGSIKQGEDFTIETNTQIDTATYDWGNSVPLTSYDTTIETATFIINSSTTGTPDNEYRGVITVSNGTLEVYTTAGWTLPPEEEIAGIPRYPMGTLILEDRGGGIVPTVRGQTITVEGLLRSTGGPGVVEPDLFTLPTAEVDVHAEAELLLEGLTTYNGGNIHGGGTLRQRGNADIVGNTTIGTTFTDWDGDEGSPSNTIIQPGALFQINSTQLDDSPLTDGYDGQVTISDTSALVVFTAAPWRMEGLMTMQGQLIPSPEAIVDGVTMINAGRIEGNGWFQMSVESEGAIAPGQSSGKIRVEQDLTLTTGSVLEYEFGGNTPIFEFDLIGVGGTATLTGAIELELINSFLPAVGDTYQVLTASSVVNTFVDIITLDESNIFDFEVTAIYSATDVVIKIDDVYLTADFDHDGDVDGNDFLILQSGLGLTMQVDNTNGDANGDGVVDGADFPIWESLFGSTFAEQSPVVAATVPEPATAVLLLLGIVAILCPKIAPHQRNLPSQPGFHQ